MAEQVKAKLVPYSFGWFCDECGKEMNATGFSLTSSPPQYEHLCNTCGKTVYLMKSYPVIEFIPE